VQIFRYQIEVSKRGHSARAALQRGDLNSALDDVEAAVTTAEQNLDCVDVTNPTQLPALVTILRDCTHVSDSSAEAYAHVCELSSRVAALMHYRMMCRTAAGGPSLTPPAN
jgi:hypothetical protein